MSRQIQALAHPAAKMTAVMLLKANIVAQTETLLNQPDRREYDYANLTLHCKKTLRFQCAKVGMNGCSTRHFTTPNSSYYKE